jgi:hypothetical protein
MRKEGRKERCIPSSDTRQQLSATTTTTTRKQKEDPNSEATYIRAYICRKRLGIRNQPRLESSQSLKIRNFKVFKVHWEAVSANAKRRWVGHLEE